MPINRPLTPEEAEYVRQQGLDPEGLTLELPDPEAMSSGRAISSTLKAHAGSIGGGGVGTLFGTGVAAPWVAGSLALAPETAGASLIGLTVPIATALIGSYLGGKAQSAIQSDETNRKLAEEEALAHEQHPILTTATDITAGALASGGRPSISALRGAGRGLLGKTALSEADTLALNQVGREAMSPQGAATVARNANDLNALKNVALQAGINPAIDVGQSLATGNGLPSGRQLIADTLGGALFSKPSWLGKKFGGMHDMVEEPSQEPNVRGLERVKSGVNEPPEIQLPQQPVVRIPDATAPAVKPPVTTSELLGTTPVEQQFERIPTEEFQVTADVLKRVADNKANKVVSVKRILSELNLTDQQANEILERSKIYRKFTELQKPVDTIADEQSQLRKELEDSGDVSHAMIPPKNPQIDTPKIAETYREQEAVRSYFKDNFDKIINEVDDTWQKAMGPMVEAQGMKSTLGAYVKQTALDEHPMAGDLALNFIKPLISESKFIRIKDVIETARTSLGYENRVFNENEAAKIAEEKRRNYYNPSSVKSQQRPDGFRISVQHPQVPGDKGYVQVDEYRNGQNDLNDIISKTEGKNDYTPEQKKVYEDLESARNELESLGYHEPYQSPDNPNLWRIKERKGVRLDQPADSQGLSERVRKLSKDFVELSKKIDQFERPLTEARILTPLPLAQHIKSETATTGSVLGIISRFPDHPFAEMAKHLLETADKDSLSVRWGTKDPYIGKPETRSSYYKTPDVVAIDPSTMGNMRVLMEEALHSMTAKKLDLFRNSTGEELFNRMNTYLKTGDNAAVKDLIRSYIRVVEHLGLTEHLFKDTQLSGDSLAYAEAKGKVALKDDLLVGAAGNPDRSATVAQSRSQSPEVGYALGNLDEFLAHAFKSERFQNLLNEIPSDIKGVSLWKRIVDSVRRLLGFDVKQGSMLESVLKTGGEIVAQDRPSQLKKMLDDPSYDPLASQKVSSMSPSDEPPSVIAKDPTKHGFLDALASTFDKVKQHASVMLGEAGDRWRARRDTYIGLGNAAIVDLQQYPEKLRNEVFAKRRESFRNNVPPNFTPEQSKVNDAFDYYGKIADVRREIGLKINEREAGKSEHYVNDSLNDKALDLFVNHPLTSEAIAAENTWVEHVFRESKGTYPKEAIREDIQNYITALGGKNNNYESVKYGAIRKAQGYGLPEGLRELDAVTALQKYSKRAASDLAMFQELESKPLIAASLRLKDPNTGKLASHPEAEPRLGASPHVKDMMKWVTDGFTGTMSASTPKINATVRLVNNAILGTATGLRDTVQMPVMALPYINKWSDLGAAMKGIANYRNESRNALLTGAKKPSIDKTQFGDILDAPDRYSAFVGKIATGLRKWQGREAIENMNRDITFSVGKELARNNIIGAKNGHKPSIDFLKRFGLLVDKDITTLTGPELETALNQVAKNFTDTNQGTYSGSGLPAGIIEGQFAPFFALQKWSVEKSNVIYKDVVKPFLSGENRLPMITYTLGSILTGAAIQQLNELLSGRKSQDPTWKEALDEGSAKNIVGELSTLMQLSSLGGIVGDTMKFASDVGLYGKTPRNLVSFPTATAALNLQEKLTDVVEALRNGENPWEVWKAFSLDMMSQNIQGLRLALNQTVNKEDVQRSDKFRDLQVFNQLEGGKASDVPKVNKYLDIDARDFKRSESFDEAMKLLPGLLKKAIDDSDGDPYELLQKLRSLKANSFQIMPSGTTMPIKQLRYIQFLKNTQGEEAATDRLMEHLNQGFLNKAKAAVVP